MDYKTDYSHYEVEDFLMDDSFLRFCLGNDEKATSFWNQWLAENPGKKGAIDQAKEIYFVLNGGNTEKLFIKNEGKFRDEMKKHLSLPGTAKVPDESARVLSIKRRTWFRVAVAAVILLTFSVSGYLILNNFSSGKKNIATQDNTNQKYKNDVAPGGDKAFLTLADGSRILLDSAANGTLTQQGNTKVLKLNSGQLAYNSSPGSTSTGISEVLYNTVSTPRGGQYEVVLPDGSKVWLNASSSLRFPTVFIGKERKVQITGEAYFEVEKNAAMPFKVYIAPSPGQPEGAEVEVLGTHFNINAYDDENSVKTTLLEGSVKVKKGNRIGLLKPGEQAQFENNGGIKIVNDVDVDQAIAWKNGLFDFESDDIKDIMRQLSRWYDVDVKYTGGDIKRHYTGSVRRQVNISEVLHMFEVVGGVQFQIEGKKILVGAK